MWWEELIIKIGVASRDPNIFPIGFLWQVGDGEWPSYFSFNQIVDDIRFQRNTKCVINVLHLVQDEESPWFRFANKEQLAQEAVWFLQ